MRQNKNLSASGNTSSEDFKLLSRLFFRLLPYQILLIVITSLNGIVDGLFASNAIGLDAMTAIGLYAPMTHFLYALSIMLVSGSQLLYGLYLVRDPKRVHSVFSVDLLLAAIVSVLTAVLLVAAVFTNATKVMVSDPVQLKMFNRYVLGQSFGIPALVLGQQLFSFLSLENQTRRTTAAGLVCFAANTLGNLLFTVLIPLGTFGLGFASSLSVWAFFALQAAYYFSGKSSLKFSAKNLNWKDAPDIVRRGYSGALSRFLEMFRCLLVNALILKFVGSVGLSAFSASNSFLGVIWALPFGMVAVQRMLFSISIGEEDRASLLDTMRIAFYRCVPLMCAVALLIILCADPLTRMFYRNPADPVYSMTAMGFRLLPLCMPLSVISLAFSSYAQASQKKLLSVVLPVVDGFGGVSLCSLVLIPLLKMNGLYISNILNGIICFLVVVGFAWAGIRHFPRSLEELMNIPADFGPPENSRLDITVRSVEDVTRVSEEVIAFCRQTGLDERRSYFAGLALEELAGNVVLHGFTKDKKKHHSADIRVARREDGILIRLRDDCVPFNPESVQPLISPDPEDPAKNIGIRLVYKIAQKVDYQNLLGCNVLTFTL